MRPVATARHLLLLALLPLLSGCGAGHSLRRIGDLEVHSFRRSYNNAHVLRRGDATVLIDSGLPRDAEGLDGDLHAAGIDPARLRAVLLTHGHADHAGGASYFQRRYGTRVLAGAADRGMLARGANDRLCPQGFVARRRLAEDQAATFPPVAATTWIEGAADLGPLVGIEGQVLPLPGHTPGSLAVVVPGAAFVGDLLRGAILGGGAAVHFFICDLDQNRRDVRALLDALGPGPAQIFVGHFGPLTRDQVVRRFP